MNCIQWPWETITINDGMKQRNSDNPPSNLTYRGSDTAATNAPENSSRQLPVSHHFALSGVADVESSDHRIRTGLDHALGMRNLTNPEIRSASNSRNEVVGLRNKTPQRTDQTPPEQSRDRLTKLINRLDRVQDCLDVLIRQRQQQDASSPVLGLEHHPSVSTPREPNFDPDSSLDRLRDILRDEPSVVSHRRLSSPTSRSNPDYLFPSVQPHIPLVNADGSQEGLRLARGRTDPPRECPVQSDAMEGPSYHIQSVEHSRVSIQVPEAVPGSKHECHCCALTVPKNRNDHLNDPATPSHLPEPISNSAILEGATLLDEPVNTPLSPNSILNTPSPRMQNRETSTPVTDPTNHDFGRVGHDTAHRSPAVHSGSTYVPPYWLPGSGPFDPMVQILRDIHATQLVLIEHQRENMRYMAVLKEQLERDLHDQQTRLQGMAGHYNQLRDYVYRSGPPSSCLGA